MTADRALERILLADDNPMIRHLLEAVLTQIGYDVVTAENGQEAVAIFMDNPAAFRIIFMDLRMPRVDGLQASRMIREKGHIGVPIVALTGDGGDSEAAAMQNAGITDCLQKPVTARAISALLDKWPPARNGPGRPPAT